MVSNNYSAKYAIRSTQQLLIDLLGMAILLGVFYAIWLGSHSLFTPDEGRYSEIAREMVVTGDYITPRLNGVVFLDKPILYYWLQASAINLFGIKEWALRFWPACVGVIGCLVIYIAGYYLFNRRTAFISAIILATSPLYYGAAHYANLDLEVGALIGSSLLFFITAMGAPTPRLRSVFLISAYVFAGLAALTKGLIGIVFPAMIIGAWILLLNRWSVLKNMRLITGLLIFAAITIPWYVLVQKANPEFFQFFFVKQQVSRFLTTEQFNNRTPLLFYVPIVLAGTFPWCIFIIQALTQHIKKIWQNRQAHSVELYLVLWFTLIFIFFSIPKSKTVGYILPIFPAFALIVGSYLNNCWENTKAKGIRYGMVIFLLLCVSISGFGLFTPQIKTFNLNAQLTPYLHINTALFLIAGIITLGLLLKQKSISRVFTTLAVTGAAFLLLFSASSDTINQKSIKPLAMQIKSELQPTDEIVTFNKYFQDLPIYLERRITIVNDWNASDIEQHDNWVREMWYGMPFQDTKDWLISEDIFWKRWNSDKRLFVFTDENYLKDIESRSKSKVYKIAQYNQVVLLSNKPA